jgi:hypothetical protein
MRSKRLHATMSALAVAVTTISAALADDAIWNTHDLDIVSDAATAYAAEVKDKNRQASLLVKLAEALAKAGAADRARDLLVKAGSMIDAPHDIMLLTARRNMVRALVRLGDETAAEALTNVEATLPVKVDLLGALGTARAQGGDIQGAREVARAIAALGHPDDPAFTDASGKVLKNIGVALVDVGAIDDALRMQDDLTSRLAALQITARAATTLCHTAKTEKARDLAARAAIDARTIAAAVDKPFQIFDPILAAAEALTACSGIASAAEFVRAILPPTNDITRSALIDRLEISHQFDLAVALARPLEADDVKGFFEQARRLRRHGDLAGATTSAIEASRIIIDGKASPQARVPLGDVVDLLAEFGAYDAAIAAAQAGPLGGNVYVNMIKLDRNAYHVRIVGAAVNHRDTENVARLAPFVIQALSEPTRDGRVSTLLWEDLLLRLARGGYRDEARPILERLLALSQDTTGPRANQVPPQRMAVLKAAMGDVPGALKSANDAGPMVAPPDATQVLALTALQFDNPSVPQTREQIMAAMERAQAALPSQVAGPQAKALSAIARELAGQRDIMGALQAVALLDVEPRDVLASERDWALSSVASAQTKIGDLRGALATTLKMTQGSPRWDSLLSLAANPPSP